MKSSSSTSRVSCTHFGRDRAKHRCHPGIRQFTVLFTVSLRSRTAVWLKKACRTMPMLLLLRIVIESSAGRGVVGEPRSDRRIRTGRTAPYSGVSERCRILIHDDSRGHSSHDNSSQIATSFSSLRALCWNGLAVRFSCLVPSGQGPRQVSPSWTNRHVAGRPDAADRVFSSVYPRDRPANFSGEMNLRRAYSSLACRM